MITQEKKYLVKSSHIHSSELFAKMMAKQEPRNVIEELLKIDMITNVCLKSNEIFEEAVNEDGFFYFGFREETKKSGKVNI